MIKIYVHESNMGSKISARMANYSGICIGHQLSYNRKKKKVAYITKHDKYKGYATSDPQGSTAQRLLPCDLLAPLGVCGMIFCARSLSSASRRDSDHNRRV